MASIQLCKDGEVCLFVNTNYSNFHEFLEGNIVDHHLSSINRYCTIELESD